jgi:DDE superfamily endonuclease
MTSIATRRGRRQSAAKRRHLKKGRHARARAARRQLKNIEQQAPSAFRALVRAFGEVFTRPTYYRFVLLVLAAILTTGNHTILNLLRTVGDLAAGDRSSFHRVFSHRRWSCLHLARVLATWVVQHFLPNGPIYLVGDDTVDEHRGKKVFGKGRHRDAVRSSHSYTAFRYGHKWVVLAVLVKFPFARRPWALPLLVALYRAPVKADKKIKANKKKRKKGKWQRHKTPSEFMRQLLKVLLGWFPDRQFIFAGDGGYGTHELARTAAKRPGRLTLVSRFYADANLCQPPPAPRGKKAVGRPRVKGAKLPSPEQVVAKKSTRRQKLNVAWYGGGRRDVEVVTGTAHWYQAGEGLVAVLWVFVHDCTGTHRDEYFFTTNQKLSPGEVIELYTGRWSIETTFQEMRAYLGLETTRGWSPQTVLRVAPCLLGLYTVVAVLYSQLPARHTRGQAITWPGKKDVTFSDAITAVRRWLWQEWIFAIPGHREAFSKLRRPFQAMLLSALAPAA